LLLALTFVQCEENETLFSPDVSETENGFSQVSFSDLPGDIQQEFALPTPLTARAPSANDRNNGKIFGDIQKDKINKMVRENGTVSYTAAIEKTTDAFYYDNYVVHIDSLGQIHKYIIRYQPSKEWYYNSQSGYDYSTFTGYISFYKPDGQVLTSSEFINGVPVSRQLEVGRANNAYGQMRSSTSSNWECSYEVQYAGVELGDGVYWTDYMITWTCRQLWSDDTDSGELTGDSFDVGTTPTGEDSATDSGGFVSGESQGEAEEEQIVIDTTFSNNECLLGVYEKMGESTAFNRYLKNFDGNMSVANLTFSVGVDVDFPRANAVTYEPSNFMITIMFNPNQLSRPPLDIARTFIHEMIHAEMYRKLLSLAGQGKIPWSSDFISSLRNDFPGLYDYYSRFFYNRPEGIPVGDPQHNLMATHFRDVIKSALREFDPTQSEETYESLAWVGLMGSGVISSTTGLPPSPTLAWLSIPQSERLQILSNIIDFINTNQSCQ
jgi:hypothetical protein